MVARLSRLPKTEVIILSGRMDSFLSPLLAGTGAQVIAAHGASADAGFRKDKKRFAAAARGLAGTFRGLLPEDKGAALSLHYRNLSGMKAAEFEAIVLHPSFGRQFASSRLLWGKKVVELLPKSSGKGASVSSLMASRPNHSLWVFGDDSSDEEAFLAAKPFNGIAVKVGRGESIAGFSLAGVSEVFAALQIIALQR